MPHDTFLGMLQMVEANRKCEGRDCLAVTDDNVEQSALIARIKESHQQSGECVDDGSGNCESCEIIARKENALRELLHMQGVDFPPGMISR